MTPQEKVEFETIEEIPADEIAGAIDEALDEAEINSAEPDDAPEIEAKADDDTSAQEVAVEESQADEENEPEAEPEEQAAASDDKDEPDPEKAEASKEEEKPSDEFGSLEDGTSEKTKERFDKLREGYDGLHKQLESVKAESNQWKEAITGTGTNPEQFGMALDYLTAVNSGTAEGLEKAWEYMNAELAVLAKALGKNAPGTYDPLSEHSDLRQRVDDGMLEEKDALEIAQSRASTRFVSAQEQERAKQAEENRAIEHGKSEVAQLGERLRQQDPNWSSKVQFMAPIVESIVASGSPPSMWAAAVEKAYNQLPAIQAAPAPIKPQAPDPIRPSGTGAAGGNMSKEPGSTLEAINQALERGY
jgi:hypothetical protein